MPTESFHSRLRDEFLASEEFETLAAARRLTAAWQDNYNHHRPHGSLGYRTPAEFAARSPRVAEAANLTKPYLHNGWYKKLMLVTLPLVQAWSEGQPRQDT